MSGVRPIAILPLSLFALAACQTGGEPTTLPTADVALFEAAVQPFVERRCGTLDCHGVAGRPLRIYSEQGLRAPGQSRDTPLTSTELEANVSSALGVDPAARPPQHLLLLTPLYIDAGGLHHVGGDIFPSTEDSGYRCLALFLEGDDATAACNDALAAVP